MPLLTLLTLYSPIPQKIPHKKMGHRKKNATSSAGLKFHRELLLSGVPLAHAQGGQAMAIPHN